MKQKQTFVRIGMSMATVLAVLLVCGRKAEGGIPSYAFVTLSNNTTHLIKYNGADFVVDDEFISGGPLGSGLNSSGSSISLLTLGGLAYAAKPGEYDLFLVDNSEFLISGGAWVAPGGRHGGVGQSIWRLNDEANNVQLITGQTATRSQLMGDFRTDLFGGALTTLVQGHADGSPAGLFSSTQLLRSVMAGGGAIGEFNGGVGVYYVKPDNTGISLAPSVTSLDNNIGGKAGAYGFFNASSQSYKYDSIGNTLTTAFALPLTAYTRVGELGVLAAGGTNYLYNSRTDSFTTLGSVASPFTEGLDFGDYALLNLNFGGGLETYVARDTGLSGLSALSYTLFSSSPLDLTRATGGFIPEPSVLALFAVGTLIVWRQSKRLK